MRYRSGEETLTGDRVKLHGNPGSVEFTVTDPCEPEWGYLAPGAMIREPKEFGWLFLSAEQIADYDDLEFVGRAGEGSR